MTPATAVGRRSQLLVGGQLTASGFRGHPPQDATATLGPWWRPLSRRQITHARQTRRFLRWRTHMPSAVADRLLAPITIRVVEQAADAALPAAADQWSAGLRQHLWLRRWPVAAMLEHSVREAIPRRAGVHGDRSALLPHHFRPAGPSGARRLPRVRVGSLAEEVTCVWQ